MRLATRDGHLVTTHPQQTQTPNGLTIWFWTSVCGLEGSGVGDRLSSVLADPTDTLYRAQRCPNCWKGQS